jgi:hypothetical protein
MLEEIKPPPFIVHLEFLENSHKHMRVIEAKGEIC